jgi:hypothetical protein
MTTDAIERDFRQKVCEHLRLEPEGIGRYRVFTPFMFDDGDHLSIVMRSEGGSWVLADEGHTFMHITYDMEEKDLQRGTRQKIISDALSAFAVQDRDGELLLPIIEERYGDALYSYVQALLKISDISFLSRERARSTFLDDFQAFMSQHVPRERLTFEWHDQTHDPEGKYPADCRINGVARPLLVFALQNDDKVRDSTIALLQYERWQMPFSSMGIFEDQEETSRKVLARFSDVCEKQFSNLASNQDRIARYLETWLQNPSR